MDAFSSTERSEDTRTDGERDLDRANLNIKSMRSSLSMLTAASAQMAAALEKRNQEYDTLLARQDEFNRRLEALQTELNLASAERSNFKEQVSERNAQLIDIQGRLDRLQAELEAVAASKTALETQLAEVQGELKRRTAELNDLTARQTEMMAQFRSEWAEMTARLEGEAVAKSAAENELRASQAQLADLGDQLAALESDLQAGLPAALPAEPAALATESEAVRAGAPQVVIEDVAPETPAARQAARVSTVAASVAALVSRARKRTRSSRTPPPSSPLSRTNYKQARLSLTAWRVN